MSIGDGRPHNPNLGHSVANGLGVYIRSDAVNPSNLHIDQQLMDAVGRMGGHTYTRTRNQFDIKTLTPHEWDSQKGKSKAAAE